MVKVTLTGHEVEQFATPRVVGRRLLPADTDFLVDLHESEIVMDFHGGVRSRRTTEEFVQSNVAHWRHYQLGLYIISQTEEPDVPIGRAGLRRTEDADGQPVADLSVVLTSSAWGQGLATELGKAITTIGVAMDLSLVAGTEVRHATARRVMEKVGFVYSDEYRRHSRAWARYRWPTGREAPGQISRNQGGP